MPSQAKASLGTFLKLRAPDADDRQGRPFHQARGRYLFWQKSHSASVPADMTGGPGWGGGRRGATKLDAVLFFMRLHMNFKLNCTNLIIVVIIIKCKFKFQVLSNAERTTWKAKSHVCYVLTCVLKITKCVACAKNETMFSDVTLKRSWFQLIFETRCTHLLKIASWV